MTTPENSYIDPVTGVRVTDGATIDYDNPAEAVVMYHPPTGNLGSATRQAFDGVWAERGWQLSQDAAVELMHPVLDDPENHTNAELRIVLDAAGGTFATDGTEDRPSLLGRVGVLKQHAESPETSPVGARLADLTNQGPATYDPGQHTVAEVNDWLVNADPTEVERVLNAEYDGQARKGIIEGPHANLTETTPSGDNYVEG